MYILDTSIYLSQATCVIIFSPMSTSIEVIDLTQEPPVFPRPRQPPTFSLKEYQKYRAAVDRYRLRPSSNPPPRGLFPPLIRLPRPQLPLAEFARRHVASLPKPIKPPTVPRTSHKRLRSILREMRLSCRPLLSPLKKTPPKQTSRKTTQAAKENRAPVPLSLAATEGPTRKATRPSLPGKRRLQM